MDSPMKKLIIIVLVIPLIFVMAAKDPQAIGHFLQSVITVGAKILDTTANILNDLLGHHL
jgi:hypothetical protein